MKTKCLIVALAVLGVVILPDLVRAQIPGVTNPTVRICYLIATNRTPQADGVANLQRGFLVYREWCREQMELYGFGPDKTFHIETEADGWTPKVYVVQSDETDSYLASDMWTHCYGSAEDEGVPIWQENQAWFLVGEAHIMQADGSISGHFVGGTGNSTKGMEIVSGNVLAMMDPKYLTNNTPYDGLTLPEVGPYPAVYGVTFGTGEGGTLSSVGSTYLGASLHEFRHGFHLHHDFRNDWDFFGNAQGNGFRGMRGYVYPSLYPSNFVRSSYAFAVQQSLSRFFHPDRTVPETTGPTISNLSTGVVPVVGGKAQLSLSVSDASGLGLALLIPQGAFGEGVVMEQRLSGTSSNVTFLTPYYNTSGLQTNQVRVQDAYGNESQADFIFAVSGVTNRCPYSNIKILPPMPAVGQTATFDASGSSDVDDPLSSVTVEWDFNGDGTYDTAPQSCTSVYTTNFANRRLYQVKVRLNDGRGGVWVSSPVGMRVGLVTHYAWTNSPSPMAPYDSWIKAARTIQEAVNAAQDGDTVLVAPGVYDIGGAATPGGSLTNRVCITNAITVRADTGPDQTVIVGASDGGGFGPAAVRCAYVGSNAVLSGFTLTNGWTMAGGDSYRSQSGGGALVMGGSVTNCRMLACSANQRGGGAGVYYSGSVLNSTLDGNFATRGGGVDFEFAGSITSLVQGCTVRNNSAIDYGGGVYCRGVGLVANSLIYSNTAGRYGGGVHLAYTSRVENCAIYANSATDTVTYGLGGGVMNEFNGGEVRSCTLADNSAGREGGGLYVKDGTGTVVNSILYFNTASSGANWQTDAAGSTFTYTCTTPTNQLPSGIGCVSGDPQFLDSAARNYVINSNSPALNAGLNSSWASNTLDVAGHPRIVALLIDMGAYEATSLYKAAVSTAPVTNIMMTAAECGGEVTLAGSYPVTTRGVCWNTSTGPTTNNSHTTDGSGPGRFVSSLTNLSVGATYYVRAYAVNAVGISYGEERSFAAKGWIEDIGAGLPQAGRGTVAWGDYDNDGDLDILLTGDSQTRIYRNDDGAFTSVATSLPQVSNGEGIWGDYDNDGDLDILLIGNNGSRLARVCRNDNPASAQFTNLNVGLTAVDYGAVAWGDYDNDGDLDILLAGGADTGNPTAKVYRNNGNGTFTDIGAGLSAVRDCDAAWADFDNDGDLDIVLAGDTLNESPSTRIYRNDGGAFAFVTTDVINLQDAAVACADYDRDGDVDILIAGHNGGSYYTRVYRNDGGFTFAQAAGLTGVRYGAVAWGDYNNDGAPDIALSGYNAGIYQGRIYHHNGGDSFVQDSSSLTATYMSDLEWGDYDNDGRLDLLSCGNLVATKVYRNMGPVSNAAPSTPTLLAVAAEPTSAALSWTAAGDDLTSSTGLSYNLRIGTTPGADDLMPAMAHATSGWRRIPAVGNAGPGLNCTITGLTRGSNYYWSVQAVDASWAGGAWAEEDSFKAVDPPYVTTAPASNITTTATWCGGNVTNEGGSAVMARGCVWNTTGQPTVVSHDGMTTNGSGAGAFDSHLTGLTPGAQTYYVRAYAMNSDGTAYGEERTFVTGMYPPGNALDFDGTNDYVAVTDADDLDMTNNFTLECWFKADSFGGLRGLISKYQTASANGYFLRLTTNNLDFDQRVTSNLNLQAGRWYHVSAVNSGGTHVLYLNGVQQTLYGTPMGVKTNANTLRLGSDFSGRIFDGQLDEARIWNTARTETEIRDAMHTVLDGSETGLVAYYKFDHLSGTALTDRTSKGHDGALANGPAWTNSTFPCANAIADRSNLRGVWISRTNALASSLMSLMDPDVSDLNYQVFGHDSGPLTQNTTNKPASFAWRLNRVWKLEGSTNLVGAFQFDCGSITSLITDVASLRLISSDDEAFTHAEVVSGLYSNDVFVVTNCAFDATQYYTIGQGSFLPTVTTAPLTNIGSRTAGCGGNVTSEGSFPVTARGVCWSTNASPTIADSHTTDGSGTGHFVSRLTGLTATQTYYVRAYAVNSAGTGYGEEGSFTTDTTPPGNALDFDGTNDFVDLGTSSVLALTNGAFTIEAWIKPAGKSSICSIVGRKNGGSGNPGYAFYVNTYNTTDARLKFETQGQNRGTVNPVITWDVWQHVAATWDGSALRFYVNGVDQPASGAVNLTDSGVHTVLGAFPSGGSYFDGTMDEARIWNVTRTESELRDAMHKALTGTEAGLLAYYRFDHSVGTTLTDLTASHFDGVLSNDPVWTASAFPCAVAIHGYANLRGAWVAQSNSLASSILSVSNTFVAGTDFRVFGHDGSALTNDTPDKPAALAWRLNRAWQVEGTGTLTGDLVFDCAGITNLIQSATRLRLLVDTDGTFSNASVAAGTYAVNAFKAAGQSLPQGGYYTIGEYGTRIITATAGPHGTINPSNAILVTYGDSTNFAITPDTYWHVGDVTTNGGSVGAVTAYTWSNVIADGTIAATFAANLAAQGTPHWWLAGYGLTNGGLSFDEAETTNPDNDPHTSGQEYIADTDPTNPASYFRVTAVSNLPPLLRVCFDSSSNRVYTLDWCSNLVNGVWTNVPGQGPHDGAGGPDWVEDTNLVPIRFYRMDVTLP